MSATASRLRTVVAVLEGGPARGAPAEVKRTAPITYWAVLGAIILAFILWIWGKWVTGPYLKSVPSGPDQPPTWMKAALISLEALATPAALYVLYRVAWRPWRRERRVSFDALMVACFFFMWFWDPFPGYTGIWFSYNTYLLNLGSWVNQVPGWLSFGQPGAQVAEPILLVAPIYMTAFFGGTVFGCWATRRLGQRFPSWGPGRRLAGCFVVMVCFDFVVEGLIMMPLGIYTYGGGVGLSLFPNTYHKFPLHQAFSAAALWTGFVALRYFRNDKGETLSERGLSEIRAGTARKTALRFLALLATMSLTINATFSIPDALFVAPRSSVWPKAIQQKSYFTMRMCGAGTDRMCPGPGVPNFRGPNTAHLDPHGNLVVPAGVRLPKAVPFDSGAKVDPLAGPVVGSTSATK
jgi:hypothetical protein